MSKASAKATRNKKSAKSSAILGKKTLREPLQKDSSFIPEKYEDVLALGFLWVAIVFFFWPVLFGGKVFLVPDNTASLSISTFLEEAKKEGLFPLWIPYIFSGMPSYGSLLATGDRSFDFLYVLWQGAIRLFVLPMSKEAGWIVLYYFIFGAGIYALLRQKSATAFQSLVGAFGGSFATLSVVWVTVGHNTKVVAVAMIPYALLFAERLRQKEGWKQFLLNSALLAMVLHVLVRSTHVQMIYYAVMAFGAYFLFELIATLSKKEPVQRWLQSAAGFLIAFLIGVLMSADTYLSVMEYSSHSIRGAESITKTYPELAPESADSKPTSGTGLSYDYATNWSFAPSEVITFFVPSYYGYGDQTYWGPQIFTHSPNFFGASILILAIVGLIYYRKEAFVQALAVVGVLALLISFGKYFPLLFDPLFNHLPFFNKFRAPSMILVLLEISACVLAGYGLKAVFEVRAADENESERVPFRFAAIGSSVLFLASVVGVSGCKTSYFEGLSKSDIGQQILARYGREVPNVIAQFGQPIFEMMKTDLFISMMLAMFLLVGIFMFIERKVPAVVFQVGVMLLVIVDFWRADARLLDGVKSAQEQQQYFQATDEVKFLQEKAESEKFRILPLVADRKSNWYAYFKLESVGGYHAAKMQLYQDLIATVGGGSTEHPSFYNSPAMMDLLNLRYIILSRAAEIPGFTIVFSGSKTILERNNWAPRAWFVKNVEQKSDKEIIEAIQSSSFNPRETAFLSSPAPEGIDAPSAETNLKITNSGLHQLDLAVKTTGKHFLFLSEVFYPAGWKCLIDGNETEILRTNFAFRGVIVPAGAHEVKFVFEPTSFAIGKYLALFSNIFLVLVLGFLAFDWVKNRGEKNKEAPTEK
ncbi:hypothetical protein Ctha_0038 [Chloroherpeton thalassium ATCC 35110]|uniref:Bacterial membrane protein YfhO n=1 Tax=Chloroherpeton thalassium (strain ATCC 35110 / GB-78) TaxID=517418 RepID=B3QSB9_CHLT3|nr:hypothetical protein [Chloroherpeton thalassium]ACF12510.1 hypothetical protein Ctha_0038 [Chloroherpeton thalassium ATCC 35110]